MKYVIIVLTLLMTVSCARADSSLPAPYQVKAKSHDDYCAKASAAISQVQLEDAGIIEKNSLNISATEVALLVKKKLYPNIWEMAYRLKLHRDNGPDLDAIVVTTSYYGECPGEHVKTYVISHEVGQLPSLKYLPNVPSEPVRKPLGDTSSILPHEPKGSANLPRAHRN